MASAKYEFGPYRLDEGSGLLTRNGEPVELGSRAFAVLRALLKAGGEVVTKDALINAAWHGTVVEEANLSVQIAALRKSLDPAPAATGWITTVSRVGYRFSGRVDVIGSDEQSDTGAARLAAGKPSVAVLPFAELSGLPEKQYFADGITEDIINALSRFRWFLVLSRNASFAMKGRRLDDAARQLGVRYVMEGSVRSAGGRVRITAGLNDATSGLRLWADRYEFVMDDMLSVQDRIAEQIAGALEPELLKREGRRPPGQRGNPTAWDLVRQGTHAFHQVTPETHVRARDLFRAALKIEADLPDPCIWLARVNAGLVAYGWSEAPQVDLQEGLTAAREAIRRDEQSPYAHYALAIVSAYAGAIPQATRAAETAVALNPSFALGHLVLGMARLFDERALAALEALERGLKLNPHDPQNFVWYNLLGFAHLLAGRPESALAIAQRARDLRPAWRPTLQLIACCETALYRPEDATRTMEELQSAQIAMDAVIEPLRKTKSWRDRIDKEFSAARSMRT